MKIESSLIYKSTIRVSGNNNRVHFEEGVMFRKSEINLRGNNCVVKIGKGTTFGGVRIVNVGTDNVVEIGCNCLFSDFIEIWASDTHSILNEQGEWINYEKPIRIGNRVWVGSRVIILKGISVNDDSIIGMGTIVTKDVPSNVVIAGLPNRIVKEGVSWTLNYGK
ncbi:acyltransferase [Arcticibacter tournemirensis]